MEIVHFAIIEKVFVNSKWKLYRYEFSKFGFGARDFSTNWKYVHFIFHTSVQFLIHKIFFGTSSKTLLPQQH